MCLKERHQKIRQDLKVVYPILVPEEYQSTYRAYLGCIFEAVSTLEQLCEERNIMEVSVMLICDVKEAHGISLNRELRLATLFIYYYPLYEICIELDKISIFLHPKWVQ